MTFGTTREDDAVVLHIRGELDAMTAPQLRETLDRLVRERPTRVIVDLSELRIIDSSGVGALVSLYKRVSARGGLLCVRGARDQPLAIFRLLKLDRVLAPHTAAAA